MEDGIKQITQNPSEKNIKIKLKGIYVRTSDIFVI